MTRDILASAPLSTAPIAPVAAPASAAPAAAAAPATAAPREPRDAFAGLLPAWDLLPASPFVRRVK